MSSNDATLAIDTAYTYVNNFSEVQVHKVNPRELCMNAFIEI